MAKSITYEHRQGLLKTGNLWHIAVGIGVSEHIDWNTSERGFKNKEHLNNWLRMIADKYSLDLTDFMDTFNELISEGWFKVKKVTGKAYKIYRTLPNPPEAEDEIELQIVGLD